MLGTLLYVAIGFGAGILSGLFGIGGGIVIVPALVLAAKFEQQAAVGTSLGALLLPVGALGAWSYYREGHLQWRASLWLALGLFVGAYLGARLGHSLGDTNLRRLFAVLLSGMAIKMWVG